MKKKRQKRTGEKNCLKKKNTGRSSRKKNRNNTRHTDTAERASCRSQQRDEKTFYARNRFTLIRVGGWCARTENAEKAIRVVPADPQREMRDGPVRIRFDQYPKSGPATTPVTFEFANFSPFNFIPPDLGHFISRFFVR